MTIREEMEAMLFECGLFEDQAKAIIELAMKDKSLKSMKGRWNDAADGYPSQFMAVLWINIKPFASVWIEENLPGAWFKSLFEE